MRWRTLLRGPTLSRRRVAGAVRLEIDGADTGTFESLKSLGCFAEIIAFQLHVMPSRSPVSVTNS